MPETEPVAAEQPPRSTAWQTALTVLQEVAPGASEYFATVGSGPVLMFIKVPDPTPGKNRVHLDLHTTDIGEHVARAVSLGAKHVADFAEYGAVWTTLTDPEALALLVRNGKRTMPAVGSGWTDEQVAVLADYLTENPPSGS